MTAKKEMYGPGGSYNVFAGKDGSKGLGEFSRACEASADVYKGMSSLKPEDAIPDYSTLDKTQCDTLNQWYTFFQKVSPSFCRCPELYLTPQRYNVVGKVTPQ